MIDTKQDVLPKAAQILTLGDAIAGTPAAIGSWRICR